MLFQFHKSICFNLNQFSNLEKLDFLFYSLEILIIRNNYKMPVCPCATGILGLIKIDIARHYLAYFGNMSLYLALCK